MAETIVRVWTFDILASHTPQTLKLALQSQWNEWKSFRVCTRFISKTAQAGPDNTNTNDVWTVWQNSAIEQVHPIIIVERFFDAGWWRVDPESTHGMTVYIPCDLVQTWLDDALPEAQAAWSSFVALQTPIIAVKMVHSHYYDFLANDDDKWKRRGMIFLKAHSLRSNVHELVNLECVVKGRTDRLGFDRCVRATLNSLHVICEYDDADDVFYVANRDWGDDGWSPLVLRAEWDALDACDTSLDQLLRHDAVRAALETIDWEHKSIAENKGAVERALELLNVPAMELPP
jgi:hypothetical protein